MIKVGCMSLSYKDMWSRPDRKGGMTIEGFLERAYELRLDGVDLHTSAFDDTGDAALRKIRLACQERGLAVSYIGVSNDFGKTGAALRADIDLVKKWVDTAARMGVPMTRIFAAWLPKGEPEERVWERMIGAIREAADHAAERGVSLGLHNHNHGCVTRTGADVLRILDAVDHPYFTHILDTGQYVGSPGASGANRESPGTERLYRSLEESAPRAVHVRAKFYRVDEEEEKWLDYPRILEILKRVGFNGWMSVVYEGFDAEPSATAVPKAVRCLRRLLREKGM